MAEYRTAVGDRIFEVNKDKNVALERLELISMFYPNAKVRLVYKNWNDVKGTPVYMGGKKIN